MSNFAKVVQASLQTTGYVADEYLAAQVALLLCQDSGAVKAMLLDGPPGAGKTALAKAVAKILSSNFVYVPAHPGSTPEDFLYDINIVQILKGVGGDATAVRSAEDVIDLGFLPKVFQMSQNGLVVALVDELDKSSHKVDSLFLSALQEGEVMVKGLGPIKANLDNIIIFFTKNGERMVSEPLMRRCRRAYLDFPGEDLELLILKGELSTTACQTISMPKFQAPKAGDALLRLLIAAANQLRQQGQNMLKAPCTAELSVAATDLMHLKSWQIAQDVKVRVAMQWLAAYPEDMALAIRLLDDKRKFTRMVGMVA